MGQLVYLFRIWLLFISVLRCADAELPEKVYCVDKYCKERISSAKTLLNYHANKDYVLSFNKNEKVYVLAKPSRSTNSPYWGVEINGEFGFVPYDKIREYSTYDKASFPLSGREFLEMKYKLMDRRRKLKPEQPLDTEHKFDTDNTDQNNKESNAKLSTLIEEESEKKKPTKEFVNPITEENVYVENKAADQINSETKELTMYSAQEKNDAVLPTAQIVSSNTESISNELNKTNLENTDSDSEDLSAAGVSEENDDYDEDIEIESESTSEEIDDEPSPTATKNITENHAEMLNKNVESSNEKKNVINSNVIIGYEDEKSNIEKPQNNDELSIKNIDINSVDTNFDKKIPENDNETQNLDIKISYEETQFENITTISSQAPHLIETTENINDTLYNKTESSDEFILDEKLPTKTLSKGKGDFYSDVIKSQEIEKIEHDKLNIEVATQKNEFLDKVKENVNLEVVQEQEVAEENNTLYDSNEGIETTTTTSQYLEEIKISIENPAIDNSDVDMLSIEENNLDLPNQSENLEILDLNSTLNDEVNNTELSMDQNDTLIYDDSQRVTESSKDKPYQVPPPSAPPLNIFRNHDAYSDQKIANKDNAKFVENPILNEVTPPSHLNAGDPLINKPDTSNINLASPTNEKHINDESPLPSENTEVKYTSFSPMFILTGLYDSFLNFFKTNVDKNKSDETKENLRDENSQPKTEYLKDFGDSSKAELLSSFFTENNQCNIESRNKSSWTDISSDLIFWLVTSAISVLMFTLGYYYLENRKQDGKLLAMVNSLQKELLCSTKECLLLKEDLTTTKEKLIGIEDSSFGSNEMVLCLKKELSESQQTIEDLQEKLSITEEELANSTEAAFELQSILNEQLVSNDKSNSLAFTITQLQSQLDEQQSTMNATKSQLAVKIEENELLIAKTIEFSNKTSILERDLISIQESLHQSIKENESKSKQIEELTVNIEKTLKQCEEQKRTELKEIQMQLENSKMELRNEKAFEKSLKSEIQLLHDNIKALKIDENNINALLDATHAKSELVLLTSEKTILQEQLEIDRMKIAELTDTIEKQAASLTQLEEQSSIAEQNAIESSTRLDVLTNYFNQKEAELLKELNTKESLWISQQGEAMSTTEKIEAIQQQIQQYKETAESMRREVAEQEAAWRSRVATLEQRVHEQWLARRAAERAAEASAREAQALRQRLAVPSPDKRVVSPLNTSENLPDPSFMPTLGNLPPILPPPPLGFLPAPLGGPMMLPPPFPPLPPHRPPPLGRLSSPPPTQGRAYSPDSRYSPDREYSPQHRARSPPSNLDRRRYNNRRYDNRYYDSEDERRSHRYETETDFSPVNTLPPSPVPNARNHKGVSSGSGHSYESIERFK